MSRPMGGLYEHVFAQFHLPLRVAGGWSIHPSVPLTVVIQRGGGGEAIPSALSMLRASPMRGSRGTYLPNLTFPLRGGGGLVQPSLHLTHRGHKMWRRGPMSPALYEST